MTKQHAIAGVGIRPSVLLVDDVEANLVALEAHLCDLNCDLVTALSGNEALRQLLHREFALILLDVQMPEMDGYEVARYARDNPKTRDVPIIFVTALRENEDHLLQGYGSGAVDFLFKPINPYVLRSKVQVFLDLHLSHERKRAIEKLQESVRMRDEFLSIASHELKTPLTALMLHQQRVLRALRKTPEIPTPGFVALIESAVKQAGRLAQLINVLLDFSRISMDRLKLELSEVALREVVKEAVANLSEILTKAGCAIDLQADSPVVGVWDRSRVEEIINNLLSNAVKFAPGKPVEIAIVENGGFASLTVHDHGIGIANDDQERIFNRFERAVPASNFGGLGLGLYISRRIAEAHGGSLRVSSEIGQGATFTVQLPLRPAG